MFMGPRRKIAIKLAVREPLYREVADITVASTGGSAKRLAGVIAEKLESFDKGDP